MSLSAVGQQDSGQSLADMARKLRKDTTDEVKMTDADTKRLFESVDRISAFVAGDTGMPKRAAVKRRLVSKADVEKYATGQLAKEEYAKSFAREELSMKKLGFLPRDFDLKGFLVKSTGQGIAAYYDPETKTISMLNWVPFDKQEPILAHELTHALQDQNYDLTKWMKAAGPNADTGDSALARKAVVEGQGMVVYVDYLLNPLGRSLQDTPDVIYQMEDPAVKAAIDSQLLHDAPMILREMGAFAYQGGLIFEGELMHKGGRNMAFAEVFAHPPRSSHEVLQPETYINGEKLPPIRIPDTKKLLSDQYDVYDSGGIGEVDVRALLKQFGERKIADDLSSAWQGGAYVTFRRKDKDKDKGKDKNTDQDKDKAVADTPVSTGDLALLYISRWKTAQAADRFARFYSGAVSQRYRSAAVQEVQACSGGNCPLSMAEFLTEEGPVIVERRQGNSVIVCESFDTATSAKLRAALQEQITKNAVRAQYLPQEEIGLRLFNIPAFNAFVQDIGEQIAQGMKQQIAR
jgi:hypothetical protein